MNPTELTGVVAEHIAAVNAGDTDAIVATFAPDAYVNDARRCEARRDTGPFAAGALGEDGRRQGQHRRPRGA